MGGASRVMACAEMHTEAARTSQNHRMSQGGRDPLGSSSPAPGSSQDTIQSGSPKPQRSLQDVTVWRLQVNTYMAHTAAMSNVLS